MGTEDTPIPGPLNNVIRIDDVRIKGHLDRVVHGTVEETLNALLDAEADRLCNAERYERTDARRDTRAGHYERQLETNADEVTLKVPKLRRQTFETAIIDHYRRREASVEEALIEVKDEPGNTWSAAYDTLGRRRSVSDPDHGTWTYSYDAAGRMTRQVDANAAVTDYLFDAASRVTRREHRNAAGVLGSWHAYAYDQPRYPYYNGGKLTSASGSWGSQTYDHDANGNRVKTSWTLAGQTHSITSVIDWRGYVTAKSYSDGDGVGTVTDPWRYDQAGRLKSIPGHITSIKYNARGQVTETVYANGVTTTNTFDASRGWLSRIVTAKAGVATPLQDITFARAATGRITSVASAGRANDSRTYYYDDLDRLVYAANAGGAGLDQAFSYNAAHNITSNSAVGGYVYASGRPHAASTAGPYAFSYDAAGNLLSKSGAGLNQSFAWNAENKLASVIVGALAVNYHYDAGNARVRKVTPQPGQADLVTRYLGGEVEIDSNGVWTKYIHAKPVPDLIRDQTRRQWRDSRTSLLPPP